MKSILLIAQMIFVLSCSSFDKNTGQSGFAFLPDLPPNIHAHCKLFDLNGHLLRKAPGVYCIFENDGSTLVGHYNRLEKLDKDFKTLWSIPAGLVHHDLRRSKFSGNYLFLDSAFDIKGEKTVRRDILRIVSAKGKPLKSVDFESLLAKFRSRGVTQLPAGRAYWLDRFDRLGEIIPNGKNSKENLESSHVNTFHDYENGFIVNCYHQKKIVFLDKNLEKITDIIDVGPRAVHDVQIKTPGQLIFYQNFADFTQKQRHSSIVQLDIKSRTFTEIYSAKSELFSARACGSVQQLGGERYFITHSNCSPADDATNVPVVEYVDLSSGKKSSLTFSKELIFGTAELIDASGYLQKNKGL